MANKSALSTLFKLWLPNDLMAHLRAQAKARDTTMARVVVAALRAAWNLPAAQADADT